MTKTNSSKNFPILIIVGREAESLSRYINEILDFEIKTSCFRACSASSQLCFDRLLSDIPCEDIGGIIYNNNGQGEDPEVIKIKNRCSNFKIRIIDLGEYKTYEQKIGIIREIVKVKI